MFRIIKREIKVSSEVFNKLKFGMTKGQRDYYIGDCDMFPGTINKTEDIDFYEDQAEALECYKEACSNLGYVSYNCWTVIKEVVLTEISYDGLYINEYNQLKYTNSFHYLEE